MRGFIKNNKRSVLGGIVATVFMGLGVFLLGDISGYEAKKLLASSLSGLNMLCNTVVLASATILALLLTLLTISRGTDSKLKKTHYQQVRTIAQLDTVLFVAAIVFFQLFNIPIVEADNVPTHWFEIIYWGALIVTSLLSGTIIVVVLMLYSTVANIISIVGLGVDHPLISEEEIAEAEQESDTNDGNQPKG